MVIKGFNMKPLFTLLLATILSSVAFAYEGGKLSITVASNRNIQVYVDGRAYQDRDNSYVLNNIQPGRHTIAVYRNGNNGYDNNDRNSRKKQRDRRGQLVYSSTVYVRPSYHVDVMINRFGKALVDEQLIQERNGNWNDDEDWNNGGYGNGGYDNGNDGYGNGGYNNDNRRVISDNDFNQLVQKLRNQWFGRMGTAKDALERNYFNTIQLRQFLSIFTAESDRLDLAKASYRNTVDKQNFRQLYDLFSYQSQTDLDRYVREYRN